MHYCPICGNEIPDGLKVCPYCGVEQEAPAHPDPEEDKKNKNKNKKENKSGRKFFAGKMAVVPVVLALAAVFLVVFLLAGLRNTQPQRTLHQDQEAGPQSEAGASGGSTARKENTNSENTDSENTDSEDTDFTMSLSASSSVIMEGDEMLLQYYRENSAGGQDVLTGLAVTSSDESVLTLSPYTGGGEVLHAVSAGRATVTAAYKKAENVQDFTVCGFSGEEDNFSFTGKDDSVTISSGGTADASFEISEKKESDAGIAFYYYADPGIGLQASRFTRDGNVFTTQLTDLGSWKSSGTFTVLMVDKDNPESLLGYVKVPVKIE